MRGLGLQFSLPDGELWRTAMIHLPVFPFRTPEAFYENLFASRPDPGTGKPDPAKMQAFLARHPETAEALKVIKSQPASSGFGDSTFHGLNAFRFINAAGESTPVRWILTPAQPLKTASAAAPSQDKDFLFDALIAQIHRQPLQWYLIVIVGQPGDPTNDATIAWPAGREQVNVGTLTLDRVESDDTSAARDINFDPLVLPAGIAPSDDPILSTGQRSTHSPTLGGPASRSSPARSHRPRWRRESDPCRTNARNSPPSCGCCTGRWLPWS